MKEGEDEVKDEAEEDDAWKLTESVFADRRKLCDARAFVNTPKVRAKRFYADWERCSGADGSGKRFQKFVTLGDKRVKAGKMALDDAIEEIRQALVPYWQLCLSAYLFYVSGDGDMTDGGITNFCPRQNSYARARGARLTSRSRALRRESSRSRALGFGGGGVLSGTFSSCATRSTRR